MGNRREPLEPPSSLRRCEHLGKQEAMLSIWNTTLCLAAAFRYQAGRYGVLQLFHHVSGGSPRHEARLLASRLVSVPILVSDHCRLRLPSSSSFRVGLAAILVKTS